MFNLCEQLAGTDQAKYETAGVLDGGRIVWCLSQLEKMDILVRGVDKVSNFFLASTSHDGTSPLRLSLTPRRVACKNTLQMALEEAHRTYSIVHTDGINVHVADVMAALDMARDYTSAFAKIAEELATVDFSKDEMYDLSSFLYPTNPETGETSTYAMNRRSEIQALFEMDGVRVPAVKGSAWSAWNAVGEALDHRPTKNLDRLAESVFLGGKMQMKMSTLAAINEMKALHLPVRASERVRRGTFGGVNIAVGDE
jgi:phage/plasmid-like protein (TIGR03299 family)